MLRSHPMFNACEMIYELREIEHFSCDDTFMELFYVKDCESAVWEAIAKADYSDLADMFDELNTTLAVEAVEPLPESMFKVADYAEQQGMFDADDDFSDSYIYQYNNRGYIDMELLLKDNPEARDEVMRELREEPESTMFEYLTNEGLEAVRDLLRYAAKDDEDFARSSACCYLVDADDFNLEVYEHWIVDDCLAYKLRDYDHKVVEFLGLDIYCRTCTGQSMILDSNMHKIAYDWGFFDNMVPEVKDEPGKL